MAYSPPPHLGALASLPAQTFSGRDDGASQRAEQVEVLVKIISPVLEAAADNRLKQDLPKIGADRDRFAPLEALGRSLAGAAPWLELGPGDDAEGQLRARMLELARAGIRNAVDPASPDYLDFAEGKQSLVDAAFLAHALLRSPTQLWGQLDATTQAQVVANLKASRKIDPYVSNWLLFSAMVEAALLEFTGEAEMAPIERAIQSHLDWYAGDGTYGDGPEWHWDYYNSFVIQPMMVDVLRVCARHGHPLGQHLPTIETRAARFAVVLERLISPEGTYPIIGRSAAYRFGTMQALSDAALHHQLPPSVELGAVRTALHAVIRRTLEVPGNFDDQGWLQIGAVGYQPSIAEGYINRGSIYLCTVGLLQLGLPASDPFWSSPAAPWTQKRAWAGEDLPADKAYYEPKR